MQGTALMQPVRLWFVWGFFSPPHKRNWAVADNYCTFQSKAVYENMTKILTTTAPDSSAAQQSSLAAQHNHSRSDLLFHPHHVFSQIPSLVLLYALWRNHTLRHDFESLK